MATVTEWTFTSDAAKWIEEIIKQKPSLPFLDAKVELRPAASIKRGDIIIRGRDGKPIITGEAKMPDKPDGNSPFNEMVVRDAHDKADDFGAPYFFTWNVNRCVLWQTFQKGVPLVDRKNLCRNLYFGASLRSVQRIALTSIHASALPGVCS